MSVNPQENVQNTTQNQGENGQKVTDKELNFAQLRQQIERERQEKLQLKNEIENLKKAVQEKPAPSEDDDSDDEPYVDHKRLKKELGKVIKQSSTETANAVQSAVNKALAEERQKMWLKANPDFYEVMQHAQTFADKDPELAETILEMPEGFERQKLVYKNIKALGLHKKEEPKPNIQDKIEQNRRSPYYQPSGIANAPYSTTGDFSETGQKSAYSKMKELQKRLRI